MNTDTKEMYQSKFITFEGTEGVGKTTQMKRFEKFLRSKDVSTLVTREPGGTKLGERVRRILLDKNLSQIDNNAELLLMFAARAQHLEEVIYPALHHNTWVLCDRFSDASYAYQGGGRGIPLAQIRAIESAVLGNFKPDLTILFMCDIKTAMQRVAKRGRKDRFEEEEIDFFERVQEVYNLLANGNSERIVVIDANKKIDKVASEVQKAATKKFPQLLV